MNRRKPPQPTSASQRNDRSDNRAEQRHQKQSRVAQLSAANVEESPHMDRGDSEGGSGQSLPGGDNRRAADSHERGAVDTQYGTRSSTKTKQPAPATSGTAADDSASQSSNPGSSEESSGTERDTMSGPRPGSSN
jgi:hypothetical protein